MERIRSAAAPDGEGGKARVLNVVVAVGQPQREGVRAVRIRTHRHARAAELAEAGHDRRGRVCLAGDLAQAARVHFEGGPGIDQRPQDRLVQLRRGRQFGGLHVGMQIPLHEVQVAERIEQAGVRPP